MGIISKYPLQYAHSFWQSQSHYCFVPTIMDVDVDHLDSLRVSLIGNKDLKYKLSHDASFIDRLINVISDNLTNIHDNHSLIDQLIIAKFLIKFDKGKAISKTQLEELNNICVKLVDYFLKELIHTHTVPNYMLITTVIDLLNLISIPCKMKELTKLILVLLQINEPQLQEAALTLIPIVLDQENEQILIQNLLKRLDYECKPIPIEPQTGLSDYESINLSLIFKLLLNLNYCLNESNVQLFLLTDNIKTSLEAVIKYNNNLLNLNIINFLNLFNDKLDLSKLIELIEFNKFSINSFKTLSHNLIRDPSLIDELIKVKIDLKLTDFLTNSVGENLNLNHLIKTNISDSLLLISLLTANNEELRLNFIKNKFNFRSLIFKLISYYNYSLKQLVVAIKKRDTKKINKIISLVNSPLFLNCLNLIRSLSRSITLLRTFFIECNIIEHLIEILKLIEVLLIEQQNNNKLVILSIVANLILDFSSFRYSLISNEEFFNTLLLIYKNNQDDTKILNSINKEQINLVFLQIIKNLMYNENEDNKIKLIDKYFSLGIFTPYLQYGSTPLSKSTLSEDTEIHNLRLKQKLIMFDILRNLSSNSNYFNEILSEFVGSKLKINWDKLLIMNITNLKLFNPQLTKFNNFNLINLMKDENYVSLILSINYIENHKFLNNSTIHLNHLLVKIWLKFLKLNASSYKLSSSDKTIISNNLNAIKLSIIWILINLTWQNNSFNIKLYDSIENNNMGTYDDEDYNNKEARSQVNNKFHLNQETSKFKNLSDPLKRATFLKKIGFINVLNTLNDNLKNELNKESNEFFMLNDLIEKIRTLLYQFDNLLNPDEAKNREQDEPMDEDAILRLSNSYLDMYHSSDVNLSLRFQMSMTSMTPVVPPSRENVNRGGEGFGYDSDDYLDAEGTVDDNVQIEEEDEEEEQEQEQEQTNQNTSSTNNEDEDSEPENYWIG